METAELSSIRVFITSSTTIWTHEPAALLLSLNHPAPGCWKILKLLPTQRHTSKTLRGGWRNKAGEMNSLLQDLLAHQAWADAEHWSEIELHGPAREDQAIQDRLHHIHQLQRLFIWAVGERKTEFAFSKPEHFKTFDDLNRYARGSHS